MTVVLVSMQAELFSDARSSTARLEKFATEVEQVLVLPPEPVRCLLLARKTESKCSRYTCDHSLQQRNLAAVARVHRALAIEKDGAIEISAGQRSKAHDLVTGSINK